MAKKIDPRLIEILTRYDERPEDALWDCHGTWVAYHAAVERIGARAGVVFESPVIIEASTAAKTVAIVVTGRMADRAEWSFGEASPGNNKNSYPYAMAEKRAKDRVILKLIGLHGLVYSEEESDDFKPATSDARTKSSASLKRDAAWEELMARLHGDFIDCNSMISLSKLRDEYRAEARNAGWPKAWLEALADEFDGMEKTLGQVESIGAG